MHSGSQIIEVGDLQLLAYCVSSILFSALAIYCWPVRSTSGESSHDNGSSVAEQSSHRVSTASLTDEESSEKISQGCQTNCAAGSKDASAETIGNGWIEYLMPAHYSRQRKRSSFKRRAHREQKSADYHWLWSNIPPYRSNNSSGTINGNCSNESSERSGETLSPARMNRRLNVAAEIVNTERTYVDALQNVHDNIYRPIIDALGGADDKLILKSKAAVNAIFSNLQDIRNVNSELLAQLEERLFGESGFTAHNGAGKRVKSNVWDPATGRLGDIFLLLTPFLRMYSTYVRNFNYALNYLDQEIRNNQTFKAFLERNILGPLNVQSFLMMPIQRIPRYRLLLTDLLHHTPPAHPDYEALQRALEMVESVAHFINEEIRSHENFMKIVDLQGRMTGGPNLIVPGRRLIRSSRLTVILSKCHEQATFFLFNDLLVHATVVGKSLLLAGLEGHPTMATMTTTTATHSSTQQENYQFQRSIPLQILRVLDLPDEPLPDELGSSTSPDGPLPSSWPTFANREGDSGGKNQQQPMRFLRNITPVPHSFLLLSKYASFQVYCDTAQDKQCWLSDLNRARSELRDQKSALLFRSDVSPIKLSAPPPTPTTIPPTKSAAAKINDGDDDDQQTEGRPDTASAGYQSPPEEDSFCAPVWIPDEAALDCMVCQQPFSLFRRRHHCRKCGIVCCADCSSRTFIVPSKTTVRIERACDPCYFQMFKMELSAAEAAIGGTQRTIPEDDSGSDGDEGSTTVDYSIASSSEESTLSDNRQRRGGKLEEELKLSTPPIAIQGEFVMPDRSRVRSVTKSLLVESAILSSSPPSQRRRWSERLLLAGNVLSNNTDRSTTGDRQRANSMFFFSTSASNNRVSSVTAECELCASQFGLLRRRYECEQCGRKVCGYCAPRIWSHHKCDLCLYSFDIGRGNSGGGFCNSGEDKRRQRAASKLSTHTNALFGMSPNSRLKRPRLGMAVRCSAGNLYGDSGSRFSHLGIAAELHQRHQHQQLEQQHRSSTAF